MPSVPRVFQRVFGNTMNVHNQFLERLKSKVKLHEVYSENDCDVFVAFVPIVSRAGTDIQAVLEKIPKHSYKHIILVSLHHTFDANYIAPDSRHCVHRNDVFAVDCLFYEGKGLLNSQQNDEALKRVIKLLGGEQSPNQISDSMCVEIFFAMLCTIIVCFFLPEGYSFLKVFLCELLMLVTITIILYYFNFLVDSRKSIVRIYICINIIMFILTFILQIFNTEDSEKSLHDKTE